MKLDYQVCAFVVTSLFLLISAKHTDQPCVSRTVWHRSVLCVCTAKYCDTVTRETPTMDNSYIYTTSEAGLRFKKSTEPLQLVDEDSDSDIIVELDPTEHYQIIEGFGGTVTDASGINWKSLKDAKLRDHLIQSYCGSKGIEYNILRVPIGSTDFSTREYAYNELPEDDMTLSHFALAQEDYEYKIPMVKACMKVAKTPVEIVTSTWSPPSWMKGSNNHTENMHNNTEYLKTYAEYHYKFIKHYSMQGVPIWAVTISKEPLRNSAKYGNINTVGWTVHDVADWIVNNIGSTLRNSTFKNVKIIVEDDQRNSNAVSWNTVMSMHPEILPYLDGVATPFYMNRYYMPPSAFSEAIHDFADKFVISIVASEGAKDDAKVDLGSWDRAELYVKNIIEALNNNVAGWIDWNMVLNTDGGPSWTGTRSDSPIIINAEAGEFYKQPLFYAIGHFSKFVSKGSKRIKLELSGRTNANIQLVAFLTPKNTIVAVIYNSGKRDEVRIRYGKYEIEVELEFKSFTTVEIPYL